ncbi:MAG TPA: hypothetical protein PLQ19_08310 [Aeromicrobium sp.]|nr:hypothetical protein [Aeromicrobium sp.]
MFGLSFEKLLLVAIVAGVVIGPQRLPAYAQRLAEIVRSLRAFADAARVQAERELWLPVDRSEMDTLDLRQYDPRRIVREAWAEAGTTAPGPQEGPEEPDGPDVADPSSPADPVLDPAVLEEASRVRPGQRYLVTGSAAHPRRVLIDALPAEDPRRLAAAASPTGEFNG